MVHTVCYSGVTYVVVLYVCMSTCYSAPSRFGWDMMGCGGGSGDGCSGGGCGGGGG